MGCVTDRQTDRTLCCCCCRTNDTNKSLPCGQLDQ